MLLRKMNPCRDFLTIIKHLNAEKVSRQLTFLCYNSAIVRHGGVAQHEINR